MAKRKKIEYRESYTKGTTCNIEHVKNLLAEAIVVEAHEATIFSDNTECLKISIHIKRSNGDQE